MTHTNQFNRSSQYYRLTVKPLFKEDKITETQVFNIHEAYLIKMFVIFTIQELKCTRYLSVTPSCVRYQDPLLRKIKRHTLCIPKSMMIYKRL